MRSSILLVALLLSACESEPEQDKLAPRVEQLEDATATQQAQIEDVQETADDVRIPGLSRALFRFERARHSDFIARSVPRNIRAAFRDDRAHFQVM